MKIATNNNETRNSKFLAWPIPFFPTKNSDSPSSDNSERDRDATAHEVRYESSNKDSATYKVYLSPFDTGSPEQWLKFLTTLNLIMTGNGLVNGPAQFNLTRALLKGDALQNFNNRARELKTETVDHQETRP